MQVAQSKALCNTHARGRLKGSGVRYFLNCPECIRLRGHLPPDQRDIPADPDHYRDFDVTTRRTVPDHKRTRLLRIMNSDDYGNGEVANWVCYRLTHSTGEVSILASNTQSTTLNRFAFECRQSPWNTGSGFGVVPRVQLVMIGGTQ